MDIRISTHSITVFNRFESNRIELKCNKSSANKMKADRFDSMIKSEVAVSAFACILCAVVIIAFKMHSIWAGWGSPHHNYFIALYILHAWIYCE